MKPATEEPSPQLLADAAILARDAELAEVVAIWRIADQPVRDAILRVIRKPPELPLFKERAP